MQALIVYLVALLISLTLAVCGVLSLFRQKIYRSDDGVTEIDVPIFGKMKSNYPAVAFSFLGVALAAFCIQRWPVVMETTPLRGTVTLQGATPGVTKPVFVFVTGDANYDGNVEVGVPEQYQLYAPRDWKTITIFAMVRGESTFGMDYQPVVDRESPVALTLREQ
jgi:hypothetical protein